MPRPGGWNQSGQTKECMEEARRGAASGAGFRSGRCTAEPRRRSVAALLAFVFSLALASVLVAGCSQGAAEGDSGAGAAPAGDGTISVTCTIDGTEGGHGVIYDGALSLPEGSNVYDALLATGVDLSVKASMGMGTYIEGIDGLMEKEQSPNSGWLFSVNGTISSVGCDSYFLEDGDAVEWVWKVDALSQ